MRLVQHGCVLTPLTIKPVEQTAVLSTHLSYVHRYNVMLTKCWDLDPDTRATFSELKSTLEDLQSTTEESPPVDLDYELQQQARGEQQHGLSCMWCVLCLTTHSSGLQPCHLSLPEWTHTSLCMCLVFPTGIYTYILTLTLCVSLSFLCIYPFCLLLQRCAFLYHSLSTGLHSP